MNATTKSLSFRHQGTMNTWEGEEARVLLKEDHSPARWNINQAQVGRDGE